MEACSFYYKVMAQDRAERRANMFIERLGKENSLSGTLNTSRGGSGVAYKPGWAPRTGRQLLCICIVFYRSQNPLYSENRGPSSHCWHHVSEDALCCRHLHHDRRVLVCRQHHAAVLRPVLSRDKVSLHKSDGTCCLQPRAHA